MSEQSYGARDWAGIGSFVVAALLIGIGAYQIGYNLSGGRGGAEMTASQAPEPVSGQGLYVGNCAGCHGGKAEGGVGPALAPAAAWNKAQFAEAVLHGKAPERELSPAMPRFGTSGIDGEPATDAQMNAIHDYLGTLK